LTACAPAAPAPALTPGPPQLASSRSLDDFEAPSTAWRPASPDSFPNSAAQQVNLTTQHTSQGQQALELVFGRPKANAPSLFLLEQPLDLSVCTTLSFDLYNPGAAASLALSLSTGPEWIWYETAPLALQTGSQTLAFELAQPDAPAANWLGNKPPKNLKQTQRLTLLIFSAGPGSVTIDHLRLSGSPFRPASQLELIPVLSSSWTEFEIKTDGRYANPFDPAEVDLNVTFRSPSGQELNVPAFWYQAYDSVTLQEQGTPGWRVRFYPSTPGQWTAQAYLLQPSIKSPPLVFTAQPKLGDRGFIRVSAQNPRYFAFEDGSLYLPVGLNIAWANSPQSTLDDYQRWFSRLHQNGGNFARVWMPSWGLGLEWADTGLGDYTQRLRQAWLLDQVFELASKNEIYLELSLLNHGAFSQTVNAEWENNPYNAANGGMLQKPQDFVTDPAARLYFERRLRYIAARWASSPHLFAWEWWNEVNWTPISDQTLFTWIKTVTPSLKRFDPYGHLISSSYVDGSASSLWALPEIDFAQQHDYSGQDPNLWFAADLQKFIRTAPNKPVIVAEYGLPEENASQLAGAQEIQFHNGLWAAPFLGYAGSGMAWGWDEMIEAKGLWPEYQFLAAFLQDSNLLLLTPTRVDIDGPADGLALQNDQRVLLWIRHKEYLASTAAQAFKAQAFDPAWKYQPAPLQGLTAALRDLQDGLYLVRWYDPQRGQWLAATRLAVSGGSARLPIPAFSSDLAVKITPLGQ
jgi:hypothetical protein